jgi:hypothetical protein
MAFTYHLGLRDIFADRGRTELAEDREDEIAGAWRRYEQAVEAMNSATEAEDFQAVGIKCRESLLALVRDNVEADWVGEVTDAPKMADFKGWCAVFADRLAQDRLRAYAKTIGDSTWDIAVSLQHNPDATTWDAELVLDATSHVLGTFGLLIHRHGLDRPARCPNCGSYAVDDDLQVNDEKTGFFEAKACRACEWRSPPLFQEWDAAPPND